MTNKRAPQYVIDRLKKARGYAAMENASFGFPNEFLSARERLTNSPRRGQKSTTVTIDQLIKEETRLYRETWLLPEIDKLIAWAEGNDDVKA